MTVFFKPLERWHYIVIIVVVAISTAAVTGLLVTCERKTGMNPYPPCKVTEDDTDPKMGHQLAA
jgi:hypothetical protein